MKKFDNYVSNLQVLSRACDENLENEFIISGIIDKFFIQFELGWKVLKVLLNYEGRSEANTGSPREIIKAAYTIYEFVDEAAWVSMLRDRNDMTHIYDGTAAKELVRRILDHYIPEFINLEKGVKSYYKNELSQL